MYWYVQYKNNIYMYVFFYLFLQSFVFIIFNYLRWTLTLWVYEWNKRWSKYNSVIILNFWISPGNKGNQKQCFTSPGDPQKVSHVNNVFHLLSFATFLYLSLRTHHFLTPITKSTSKWRWYSWEQSALLFIGKCGVTTRRR